MLVSDYLTYRLEGVLVLIFVDSFFLWLFFLSGFPSVELMSLILNRIFLFYVETAPLFGDPITFSLIKFASFPLTSKFKYLPEGLASIFCS